MAWTFRRPTLTQEPTQNYLNRTILLLPRSKKKKFRNPVSGTKVKDQKMLSVLYHTGNYKGFKSHVSGTRDKDQFIFFYDLRAAFKK